MLEDIETSLGRELPRSPTGRVPRWVVDEALGRPADAQPWRAWEATPAPRRRRWSVRVRAVVLALVFATVAAVVLSREWTPSAAPVDLSGARERPTPGFEEEPVPLGAPPQLTASSAAFRFRAWQPGSIEPVGYDPCRPVHWVLQEDHVPLGGERIVQDAVARVAEATGLRFVYDGQTDEPLVEGRPLFQPDRYGDRWVPVLIAFNTVAENPGLAGGVAGRGGSSWIELPGQPRVYVSGTVSVDVEWFTAAQFTPGLGVAAVESVVLHELGHVVGLDHVDDRTQLMAPEGGPVRDYQDGDRSGLALLGAGECAPGV